MSDNIQSDNKSRVFAFIFGREENKKWTLSLYNAVNGTSYTEPDDFTINTLGDTVYMGMKNDLSFIIRGELNIYEHQSTYNPNMPVRQLMYLGHLYSKHIKQTNQNIYGSKLMTLPVPKLMTFYNGLNEVEDCILKLSDSFPEGIDPSDSDVEVKVHMINIRPQYESDVLNECKPLAEYAWFVEAVRRNKETMELEPAVDTAIDDMPEEYMIKSYLVTHRAEVKDMCITEYNEAETMQLFKEEGREEGIAEGIEKGTAEGIRLFIQDKFEDSVPEDKIISKLCRLYKLSESEASRYVADFKCES